MSAIKEWAIVTCATSWSDVDYEVVARFTTEEEATKALQHYDNCHSVERIPQNATYLSSVTGKWI